MDLKPGEELKITSHVHYAAGNRDISDLIQLPINELVKKEEDSVAAEESICKQINDKVHEWEQQAAQTVCIRQAKQYLRTLPVKHTANQWTEDQYGNHEMSNKVYKFSWRVYERTRWSNSAQESIPVAWELSWSLTFNTTSNPDLTGNGRQIAGQNRKVFKDKAALEKYLQGRIKAFSPLFTEISPPIPEEHKKRFCVNGVLLPSYTVEDPDTLKPDEAAIDDLLSFLDDEEMGGKAPALSVEPQPEEKNPQAIWEKHRKQRTGSSQRKPAPVR